MCMFVYGENDSLKKLKILNTHRVSKSQNNEYGENVFYHIEEFSLPHPLTTAVFIRKFGKPIDPGIYVYSVKQIINHHCTGKSVLQSVRPIRSPVPSQIGGSPMRSAVSGLFRAASPLRCAAICFSLACLEYEPTVKEPS